MSDEEDQEEQEDEKLRLYSVRITRVVLVAAKDSEAAWDLGEEHTMPDPNDLDMEGVDEVQEVDRLTEEIRGKIPDLDGPHNTLTVQQLIDKGLLVG